MKSVLMIFSQGAASGQTLMEALSATMVLATFGLNIKVCLINEAISLLQAPHPTTVDHINPIPFKPAYGMVESFEFYDLLPVWVCQKQQAQLQHLAPTIQYEMVNLSSDLLAQFDQVLYW